ncbi:MAG: rhomboid family intramembrane serine protease [Bacteroidales bacterium]
MKTYLKTHFPKISFILVLILFLTNILTLFTPKFSDSILLYPSNLSEPFNWYRLITYPLYVGGLTAWFFNSLVILFAGYIIESKLQKNDLIGLIFLSSVIGGLVYIIINQNDTHNLAIASPTIISWGYWGATMVIGLKNWRTLYLFEKIVMILFILNVFWISNENLGFLLGQITVIITIMIITLIKYKK